MTGCKKCTTERLTWNKNGEGLMTVVKETWNNIFENNIRGSQCLWNTHSPEKSLYVRDKAGNKYRIFTYKKTNMILSWGLLLSDFSERKEIVAASTHLSKKCKESYILCKWNCLLCNHCTRFRRWVAAQGEDSQVSTSAPVARGGSWGCPIWAMRLLVAKGSYLIGQICLFGCKTSEKLSLVRKNKCSVH